MTTVLQSSDAVPARATILSIIVPVYNESARIPGTLRQVLDHLRSFREPYEVVVVDDGSVDGTADLVEKLFRDRCVRLLRNPANCGKGAAVRNGVLHAGGEYVLFTDADLSAPIEEMDRLLGPLRDGYDVVIGSRALKPEWISPRQPPLRVAAGRMFNLWTRWITGLDFQDTQCGFKAFRRPAARAIFSRQRITRFGFDVEMLYLARKLGCCALEVPVHWGHSEGTTVHPFRDGRRMLADLFRIRWNDWRGRYGPP